MKSSHLWLGLAVLALGAAAWLMPSADPAAPRSGEAAGAPPVKFPDHAAAAEQASMRARRTLPPQATAPSNGKPAADNDVVGLAKRDPMLVALAPDSELLVFEASAFLKRPVGQMMGACLRATEIWPGFSASGLDLDRVERVGVGNPWAVERLVVIAGDVSHMDPLTMYRVGTAVPYGAHSRIYPPLKPDEALTNKWSSPFVGIWNNTLLLASASRHDLEAAIDRLDGRVPSAPAFPPEEAYSELYGRISARGAAEAFSQQATLTDQLRNSDLRAHFHVNAHDDLAVVVDAHGADAEAQSFARTLAAAFAARRVEAATIGDKRLLRLLDQYSVTPAAQGFRLKAAFPESFLHDILADCARAVTGAAGSGAH